MLRILGMRGFCPFLPAELICEQSGLSAVYGQDSRGLHLDFALTALDRPQQTAFPLCLPGSTSSLSPRARARAVQTAFRAP